MARRRKFDDGGGVREGRNENIGDDTRAKAMEYIRKKAEREDLEKLGANEPMASSESETSAPRAAPKPAARKSAPTTPKASTTPTTAASPAAAKVAEAKQALSSMPEESPAKSTPSATSNVVPRKPRNGNEVYADIDRAYGERRRQARMAEEAKEAELKKADRERAAVSPRTGNEVYANIDREYGEKRRKAREAKAAYESSPEGKTEIARQSMQRSRDAATPSLPRSMRMEASRNEFAGGGKVKKYAAGGSVSASRRADGIAKRGKTKGRIY